MNTEKSTPVSPQQVTESLDELILTKHPNRFQRIKQLLLEVMEHGIDWREGNPFKQIAKHIEQQEKAYEAALEGREKGSSCGKKRKKSHSRRIKVE